MSSHIIHRFDFDNVIAGFFKIIENPGLYLKYKSSLESELFFYNDVSPKSRAFRKLLQWFHEMMDAEKTNSPSLLSFSDYINSYPLDHDDNKLAKELFRNYSNNPEIRKRMVDEGCFHIFVDYLKIIRFIKYSNSMFEEYQGGNVDKAAEMMQQTLMDISALKQDEQITFDAERDLDGYLFGKANDNTKVLNLGVALLDSALGGFEERTLNLFISVTNGGKSMMAHHLIKRSIEAKMHVHIACVEDRPKSFARKLTACLTGIPLNRFKQFTDPRLNVTATTDERNKIEIAKKQIAEYVQAEFIYGQGIEYVHKKKKEWELERLSKKLPVAKVDIVDYTGHIAGKSHGDKMYEQMRNAYGLRKDYALVSGKICFDFAQVNREGSKRLGERKSLETSDLAGSFDLAQVCDNIISINRGVLDVEQQTAKLKITKARDGEAAHEFEVKTNLACAQIIADDSETRWLTGRKDDVAALKALDPKDNVVNISQKSDKNGQRDT